MKLIRNFYLGRTLLVLLIMVLYSLGLSAQTKTVRGSVVDDQKSPIPGASILIKGTSSGTITDDKGNFQVQVSGNNAVLIVSFMGMETQQVPVGTKTQINVTLLPNAIGLQEVVAVGYGVVKKKDITGSVGSISSEKLLAAPVTSLDAGMKGKIAGVSIQQTSGAPGQEMKIRIRGASSINYSNNPLYVIDGFIGADISSINPNDIASIDILKDASATAVYGSRGANGVVLITTNTPKKGNFKISLEATTGVSNMTNKYDLLSATEQMELMNLQDIAQGKTPAFSAEEIQAFKDGTKKATDWVDLVTRQGISKNYSLTATGGNDQLQYYFSANNLDEQGIVENTFYKRSSIRSNITGNLSKRVKMVFNTFGVHTSEQGNTQGTGGLNNPIGQAVNTPQMWAPYEANGELKNPRTWESYGGTFLVGNYQHPLQKIRQNQENMSDRLTSNLDLSVDLGHNFSLVVSNSGSFTSNYSGNRTLEDYITTPVANITASQNYGRSTNFIHSDVLNYENKFGKSNLKVSGVYEYSKSIYRNMSGTVGTLATLSNEWYNLSLGKPTNVGSNYGQGEMRSYMGRLNYSYADKYLLTASMRADGASNFLPENRWGYFPSAALAWRASEEGFIKDLGWVYNLKLRLGFGATGNVAVSTKDIFQQLNAAQGPNESNYPMINGAIVNGVRPAAPTDPNLTWEETKQYNAGIDYAMFGGRLSAVLDVYDKITDGVIIATSIPRYTGFPSYTSNVASISNKGIEFAITGNIINNKQFTWDANFNFSKNINKIEDLGNGVDQIFVANENPLGVWNLVGGGSKYVVRKGESMGAFYGLKAERLWQLGEEAEAKKYNSKPGEWKYADIDGVVGYSAQDRQIIGNASPDFNYAFGTTLAYKGIDLNIQCVGSVGGQIYNFTKNILSQQAFIQNADYRNRWTPENPNATFQTMPVGNDYSMQYVVSQYVEDGSYFKVSNITLGYTLPNDLVKKVKLGSVRIYASANNVLTITNYSGLDPEGSSTPNNSDAQAGIDAFSYPLTRTITGGIKVTF